MVLSQIYRYIYDAAGGNEDLLGTVGSFIAMSGSFWALNCMFLLFDVFQWPKWVLKFKVQKDKNVPMDMQKFYNCLRTVLFHTLIVNGLMCYPHYKVQQWLGISFHPDDIPGPLHILKDFAIFVIVVEITFYYSHRLIHHPLLYKRIHKKHHEWTAPIGITAVYATLPEYLLGNTPTVILGPWFARSHIAVAWLWFAIAMFSTTFGHSGYHLPIIMRSPLFHDFHHYNFEGNYGSIGFLDWLHGTDAQFRKTNSFLRHKQIFGFTPADQLVPTKEGPHKVLKAEHDG